MRPTPPQDQPVSVIVPARNEAATIARVVERMARLPLVDEVLVVDNGSEDGTAQVASTAGARVVAEARAGMGHAIRAGFLAARNDWVMKVDADLDRFDTSLFPRMIAARAQGTGLIKGQWQDPRDPMPMTRYLVQPALRQMFPALGALNAPNSGLYAFDQSLIAVAEIVGDYAADLDVMLRVHAAGAEVTEVDIGRLDNNPRDPGHYAAMSDTIMEFFLRQRDLRITDDIVVLSNTAIDVALGGLGTIVAHARAGGRVALFLDDPDGADVLQQALASFPTVTFCSLSEASDHLAAPSGRDRRVIAASELEHHAVVAQMRGLEAEVLVMPGAQEPDVFRADTGKPIEDGLAIKSAVLDKMGIATEALSPREIFRRL